MIKAMRAEITMAAISELSPKIAFVSIISTHFKNTGINAMAQYPTALTGSIPIAKRNVNTPLASI